MSFPESDPEACHRPHVDTDASPSSICKPDLTKTIFACLACSSALMAGKRIGRGEGMKENTLGAKHRDVKAGCSPHKTALADREEGSKASTTLGLKLLLSR